MRIGRKKIDFKHQTDRNKHNTKKKTFILTINNQLSFGADLTDTVVCLTNVNTLVTRHHTFYY